jgi:hypothetical protein
MGTECGTFIRREWVYIKGKLLQMAVFHISVYLFMAGCTILRRQVDVTTKFSSVAPNV